MSSYFLWHFSYAGDVVFNVSLLGIVFAVMFVFEAAKAMRSTITCEEKYFQTKKNTAFYSFLPMNFMKFLRERF